MALQKPTRHAALDHIRTRHVLTSCAAIVALASAYLLGGWRSTLLVLAVSTGVILAIAGWGYLRRLSDRIDRLDKRMERQADPSRLSEQTHTEDNPAGGDELDAPAAPLVDLALGPSNPSALVAATLDRSAFPRLATSIADSSPTEGHAHPASDAESTALWSSEPAPDAAQGTGRHGLTTLNLMRQWKHGLRSGNLAVCRRTYAALVDASDAQAAASLKRQLDDLVDRVEKALRAEFVASAQRRDYAGLLALGQRIVELLPDRPIAAQFLRLKPQLEGRSLLVRRA